MPQVGVAEWSSFFCSCINNKIYYKKNNVIWCQYRRSIIYTYMIKKRMPTPLVGPRVYCKHRIQLHHTISVFLGGKQLEPFCLDHHLHVQQTSPSMGQLIIYIYEKHIMYLLNVSPINTSIVAQFRLESNHLQGRPMISLPQTWLYVCPLPYKLGIY